MNGGFTITLQGNCSQIISHDTLSKPWPFSCVGESCQGLVEINCKALKHLIGDGGRFSCGTIISIVIVLCILYIDLG